jgi:uncharacterized membrane protein SpoIIM required for sporulation
MILDLENFVGRERPFWGELEKALAAADADPNKRRDLGEARRFHYLYQRASSDLSKIQTFSGQPELRSYLEGLVARAYIELHGERGGGGKWSLWRWLVRGLPGAFRRRAGAFWLAVAATLAGGGLGAFLVAQDRENMLVLVPPQFSHVLQDPSERVREEEAMWSEGEDHLAGAKGSFAGQLMLNNIKVAILALAVGALFGVLTFAILFYNGVLLGAIAYDYVRAGETEFLLGWLLPHGVPELTAIFIGGQAGLVLAGAVVGWGSEAGLRARLAAVRADVVTLAGGFALMLVWAGLVEAFFSQYHYPVVSYSTKIAFGLVELALLVAYYGFCGRGPADRQVEVGG